MRSHVEIDEIDDKILHALIVDARAKLKDIARGCGISSVAVLNRIKRLKANGVLKGAALFPNITKLGGAIFATLGMNIESGGEEEILRIIQEQTYLIEPSRSVGKYDLFALVYAENVKDLQRVTDVIKKHSIVKRITVNIWVPPARLNFNNIELRLDRI